MNDEKKKNESAKSSYDDARLDRVTACLIRLTGMPMDEAGGMADEILTALESPDPVATPPEEWRSHSFGYGPNHNVCWDCGAEYKDRQQNSNCPGFVKDETVRRRIEAAAVERGYEKGIGAVAGQLQETYDKIRESDPKLHRYLWDFARNLPSKR